MVGAGRNGGSVNIISDSDTNGDGRVIVVVVSRKRPP